MKRKKLLGIIMSMMLVYSNLAPVTVSAKNGQAAAPFKPAIIQMLKDKGEIPKDATAEQIEAIYKKYINKKFHSQMYKENKKINEIEQFKTLLPETLDLKGGEAWDGKRFDFNPLVILMDFKDYQNQSFASKEKSPMNYKNFPKSLYEDMLFGEESYKGPNGEDFISLNKFYQLMSGGSHGVKGKVFGWYHAKEKAAFYGSNGKDGEQDQINARKLIVEALDNVTVDPEFDIREYDKINNATGERVPDGIIDQIIVIHAGRGEEMGGGSLREDAIWPFRSGLSWYGDETDIKELTDVNGNKIKADDFLIVEQDCTPGLVGHEFGHIVGAPDEYGEEEPVQDWSLMAAGSYTGKLPGTKPVQMSPFSRERMQERNGGNWFNKKVINYKDIDEKGIDINLHQSYNRGEETDLIRINLPDKETVITKPTSGKYMYFSGAEDNLRNSMSTTLDLIGKSKVELQFKTFYDIDPGFDFASVQVREEGSDKWTSIAGNITTTDNEHDETPNDPTDRNPGNGITYDSGNQWVDAKFDLSAYANKKIELKFYFWTDTNTPGKGMYIDDVKVLADGIEILNDDVEGQPKFNLPKENGFTISNGIKTSEQYYLVEWRNGQGQDEGITELPWTEGSKVSYDPGLLIWYVDSMYFNGGRLNQREGNGNFALGVVDADQRPVYVRKGAALYPDDSRYQLKDATFSLRRNSAGRIDWPSGDITEDIDTTAHPYFHDVRDYLNSKIERCGRNIPKLGLKIYVTQQSQNDETCTIHICK